MASAAAIAAPPPAPPPTPHETSPAAQTAAFLAYWHDHQAEKSGLYIHAAPISYYDGKMKASWLEYTLDADDRHTYSTFTHAKRGGAKIIVGVFQTWGGTWVGQPRGAWVNEDWHCWLAAVQPIQGETGRMVVFWDSNGADMMRDVRGSKDREPISSDLSAPQRRLLTLLKADKTAVRQIWYGGSGNTIQNPRCTQLTMAQVREWAENGVPATSEALGAAGFILIPVA